MLRIGRQTERAVRLWASTKAWKHHITPVTPDAFPPYLKTSVFDDPVTCSIIENTSPEVYCTFKAACSELKAVNAVLDHHTRHNSLPDPKRWEAAHRELMPSLTLLATNNGDEAMLKSLPMLPVIALNVTVALHPSYVITLLSVLSNAFGFEVVLIHTNPFVSEDTSANVEDDIRGSSPRECDEDPRSEV